MSRTKTVLTAPSGVSESNIEGTFYWPDDNGQVETTNAGHVALLERHGYSKDSEVSIMPPALSMGLMNIDEMGLSQLRDALTQRGLSYPESADRTELERVAQGWNQSRRGRQNVENIGGAPLATSAAPAPALTREQLLAALAALDAGKSPPAPAPAPVDPATASAADVVRAAAPTAPAGVAKPDFSTFSNAELKGWLATKKVDFKGNAATAVLIDLANKKMDEIIAERLGQAA